MSAEIESPADGGDDVDLFGRLPDEVFSKIIALLDVESGARCSAVSPRFRRLWLAVPICFDDDDFISRKFEPEDMIRCLKAMDSLLAADPAGRCRPVRRICLSRLTLADLCRVSGYPWFPSLLRTSGVETIGIYSILRQNSDPLFFLHPLSFKSPSLLRLDLASCSTSYCPRNTVDFPKLKSLHLTWTYFRRKFLASVLDSCPALETLKIHHCHGLTEVTIRSKSLKVLTFMLSLTPEMATGPLPLEQLPTVRPEIIVIEDAPNLERLMLCQETTKVASVQVVHAPKLEVFGFVNADVRRPLELGKTRLQIGMPSSLRTSLHSVKRTAIAMDFNDDRQMKMAFDLLRCFPSLESLDLLVVESKQSHSGGPEYSEQMGSFDCLNHHLRSVSLEGCLDEKTDVGFIKFLILKARVLEVLSIVTRCDSSRKWAKAISQLCNENRASPDAKTVVTEDEKATEDKGDRKRMSTWEVDMIHNQ